MADRTLVDTIAQQLDLGSLDLEESVARLADLDRIEDLAALVERRIGLPRAEALTLLLARAELPAALLCRALRLGLNGYSAVLRMRHRRRRDGRTLPATLLSAYGGIARPTPGELSRQAAAESARVAAEACRP